MEININKFTWLVNTIHGSNNWQNYLDYGFWSKTVGHSRSECPKRYHVPSVTSLLFCTATQLMWHVLWNYFQNVISFTSPFLYMQQIFSMVRSFLSTVGPLYHLGTLSRSRIRILGITYNQYDNQIVLSEAWSSVLYKHFS